MKRMINLIAALIFMLMACDNSPSVDQTDTFTNSISSEKMLLVLSAPSVNDSYYAQAFDLIVDFQVNYAKKVMGHDNVILLVNDQTRRFYQGRLPEDVLLSTEVYDIWMRDFTTINPEAPVQFTYTWASMTRQQSREVQESFSAFADQLDISRDKTDLLIDGGNIVDNYDGRVITTTRFLEDNRLSYEEGVQQLRQLLNASEVAIIRPDEEVLAHSDGMVSWVDNNTLMVNDYDNDPELRNEVLNELNTAFPGVNIVEMPVDYAINPPGQWDGFESACGINLNATVTYQNIYVPTFNMAHETEALRLLRESTSKNVIEVDATGVCAMGGSVRCLTWQLTGTNAEKLILAARSR